MSWKTIAGAAVVTRPDNTESADTVLCRQLYDAIPKLGASDKGFAQSLYNGFTKYHSFTERQRPYVEKLIAKASAPRQETRTPPATRSAGLDLKNVPPGYYAVEQRRILIDKPIDGKWAGWTFIKDGSEYGAGRRIAGGRPEWGGKVEVQGSTQMRQDAADLAAIAANPLEASKQYGRITSTCGVCGRTLENPESVAAGIGPVCAGRF